ncbi:hypothetical protein [uncultured Tateyamaria sp.]|uniref:hypothetical protein n=1 Tax=Tateyamaria sp. 1078 TaxID=3417464 RepID=UPI00261B343A|nr:hypothetical protein [uncultured Tateyamaria sp.]
MLALLNLIRPPLGLKVRVALLLFVIAGLWGAHRLDKAAAVAKAMEGVVKEAELRAAEAEVTQLKARLAAAAAANENLQERAAVAEGEARRFEADLEAFEHETDVNPDGVVDDDLLRRLRSN